MAVWRAGRVDAEMLEDAADFARVPSCGHHARLPLSREYRNDDHYSLPKSSTPAVQAWFKQLLAQSH